MWFAYPNRLVSLYGIRIPLFPFSGIHIPLFSLYGNAAQTFERQGHCSEYGLFWTPHCPKRPLLWRYNDKAVIVS